MLIAFAVTVWAWPPSVSVWLWASVATLCPCVGSETPWACSLEPTACAWPGSETPWAWPQLLPVLAVTVSPPFAALSSKPVAPLWAFV